MKKSYIFTTAELKELMNNHEFKSVLIYTAEGLITIPDTYIDKDGTMILKKYDTFLHAHRHETCWSLTHIDYHKAINNVGYKLIGFGGHAYTLHRVMASTWLEKPEGKNDINHKDLNKRNNSSSNLEWCTKSENMTHYHKNKNKENNAMQKTYTWDELFDMYKNSNESLWDILSSMTAEDMEKIVDDAQKHDFAGTYEFTMFILNVMEVK